MEDILAKLVIYEANSLSPSVHKRLESTIVESLAVFSKDLPGYNRVLTCPGYLRVYFKDQTNPTESQVPIISELLW